MCSLSQQIIFHRSNLSVRLSASGLRSIPQHFYPLLEQWLSTKGYDVKTDQIPNWRRTHMSDLTKAFDFSKVASQNDLWQCSRLLTFMQPDYSIPSIPIAAPPSTADDGSYNGYAQCEATHPEQRPPVPYGKQSASTSLVSEQGFKSVRGALTEGRYLVLEMNGYALANLGGRILGATRATRKHDEKAQRWVAQQTAPGGTAFNLKSAVHGEYVSPGGKLDLDVSAAQEITVMDLGHGRGYTLQIESTGRYLIIGKGGKVRLSGEPGGFRLFSVTYNQ